MAKDKYTAVWVSHSSISDFLNCPRAYYLKHIYKNPKTGKKITVMSPPLALGQAVHDVVESLSNIKVEDRFKESLVTKLEAVWAKITGKKGGFKDTDHEAHYKQRATAMLQKVMLNPGPLQNLAVKIKTSFMPNYWISEEDNIILAGKIDWLEYLPDTNSVHIIDFKTGNSKENKDSLQLPIYHLLVTNTQNRKVDKASYWYLEQSDELVPKKLPDLRKANQEVLKVAKQIKLARQLQRFACPHETGCRYCKPLEMALKGETEVVGTDQANREIHIMPNVDSDREDSSILL